MNQLCRYAGGFDFRLPQRAKSARHLKLGAKTGAEYIGCSHKNVKNPKVLCVTTLTSVEYIGRSHKNIKTPL